MRAGGVTGQRDSTSISALLMRFALLPIFETKLRDLWPSFWVLIIGNRNKVARRSQAPATEQDKVVDASTVLTLSDGGVMLIRACKSEVITLHSRI